MLMNHNSTEAETMAIELSVTGAKMIKAAVPRIPISVKAKLGMMDTAKNVSGM